MAQQPGPIDIYARVSRKGDERQLSPLGQLADCRARLADLGMTPGAEHMDDGKSAWSPRVHRKGWDALMARLESGAAGGVIVFDLARFSRRPMEGERLIEAAERGLIVLDSESSYDLRSPNGKKQFRDHLSGAAYESDRSSSRIARGKRTKAMSGQPNGSARPFGFAPDLVTVRESEAEVLRDLTRRFLAGETQDSLLRWLNDAGILTSYGKSWTRAGLRQVLTRHRNAGQIVYTDAKTGKTSVVGRLPGEPVIDPEDFGLVLAQFAARRAGRPPGRHYLASGVVVCGLCGKRLGGRPRPHLRPYPDGEVKRDYWCCPSAYGGCGRIAVDQRGLDLAAAALAVAILDDPRHAGQIDAAAARAAGAAAKLDTQIAEIEYTALKLADRLGRGEFGPGETGLGRYDAAVKPLDKRLGKLRAERKALGAPDSAPAPAAPPPGGGWSARWDAADLAERRNLLRMALRGKVLAVGPADPSDRANVTRRISIGDPA